MPGNKTRSYIMSRFVETTKLRSCGVKIRASEYVRSGSNQASDPIFNTRAMNIIVDKRQGSLLDPGGRGSNQPSETEDWFENLSVRDSLNTV